MSTLARRSALVLALLFGLVFAIGTGVMYYLQVPLSFAIVFAVVIVLLQFAIGPWIIELIFKIEWVQPESIHPDFERWLRETCAARKIPVPRLGVIRDGNPNAFTYGHTPKDARVVVTAGLLDMLDAEETHAVVAHELGHVAHYDFIVMTVAQVVPLILYYVYVWTRDRARNNREIYSVAVAIGAYVTYIVSEYIVLFLSRVREYFADEASAVTVRNPNALSSALVKIAYGLARRPQAAQARAEAEQDSADPKAKKKKRKTPAFDAGQATAALGICNAVASGNFTLSSANADGSFSPEKMAAAMQWDLKNPWGKWYELNSTHPLTARRILAMNRLARRMGLAAAYDVDPADAQKSYTGNFFTEFLLFALPLLGALVGYAMTVSNPAARHGAGSMALAGLGLGLLVKTDLCYPIRSGEVRTVESLVGGEMDVSAVRPVPCALEGTIIGRGVPGLFFSDDLVLHDGSGFMTLIYRQPFGILEFLFGWLKAGEYVGRKARVYGWYRRAPVPYLEIRRVQMLDGPTGSVRCYYVWGLIAIALALIGAGLSDVSIVAIVRHFL